MREWVVSGDGRWMAVSRFEPTDTLRRILEWRRQADVAVETPIQFRQDGSQRVTVIGDDAAISQLFDEARDEDAFSFEVLKTGNYDPDAAKLARSLTSRQEEILTAAVEVGYYEAPREATQAAVAEAVGLAPSTVGDHLRGIGARVFGALAR